MNGFIAAKSWIRTAVIIAVGAAAFAGLRAQNGRNSGANSRQTERNISRGATKQAPAEEARLGPMPTPPWTDFRAEAPGKTRKITVNDLPQPFATPGVSNFSRVVPRPADAWPKAPAGFKVELFADGLNNPRLTRTAPNGDIFVAETRAGRIRVYRGINAQGKPQQSEIFATGLNEPFGIAFYPPGNNPQWIY